MSSATVSSVFYQSTVIPYDSQSDDTDLDAEDFSYLDLEVDRSKSEAPIQNVSNRVYKQMSYRYKEPFFEFQAIYEDNKKAKKAIEKLDDKLKKLYHLNTAEGKMCLYKCKICKRCSVRMYILSPKNSKTCSVFRSKNKHVHRSNGSSLSKTDATQFTRLHDRKIGSTQHDNSNQMDIDSDGSHGRSSMCHSLSDTASIDQSNL